MGAEKWSDFERKRDAAFVSLILEAVMHLISNRLFMILRFRTISASLGPTLLSDFIPGYIDALSLGLHWGFLFGNGVQALFRVASCVRFLPGESSYLLPPWGLR